ncbi:MAG: hypothetical protein OQK69_02660 [Gammaproteobacteria bacterium]|nr:hypothetical protein [Gammaproteobacteria bacterium]
MSHLQNTIKDGFSFDTKGNVETDLALISLKIALKSYFTTYQTFKNQLHIFEPSSHTDQKTIDFNHRNEYCEACAETIVHFQHFAELVCKKLLRDDHPLLSDVALNKPEILHKLLHGNNLSEEEQNAVRSIEFSEALKRLITLIDNESLTNHSSLSFIKNHKETLVQLNTLRNRIWHRGVYILRYPALDTFVGKYILPFVVEALKLPSFNSHANMWKYNGLHSQIDPIEEIIKEASNVNPDIGKLALLKELGKAAYENPLMQTGHISNNLRGFLSSFDNKNKRRAERIAIQEASQEYSDITVCPVCGVKSLIIYDDTDYEHGEDYEDIISAWRYTYMVKCECCTFNLEGGVKNASEYDLSNIEDYWVTDDLA